MKNRIKQYILMASFFAIASCTKDIQTPNKSEPGVELQLIWKSEMDKTEQDYSGGFFIENDELIVLKHTQGSELKYHAHVLDINDGRLIRQISASQGGELTIDYVHPSIISNTIVASSSLYNEVYELDLITGEFITTAFNPPSIYSGSSIDDDKIFGYKNEFPDNVDTFHFELLSKEINENDLTSIASIQQGKGQKGWLTFIGKSSPLNDGRRSEFLFLERHIQGTNDVQSFSLKGFDVLKKQFNWEMPNFYAFTSRDFDGINQSGFSIIDKNPADISGFDKDYLLATFHQKLVCVDLIRKKTVWEQDLKSLRPIQFGSKIIAYNNETISVLDVQTGDKLYSRNNLKDVGIASIKGDYLYYTASNSAWKKRRLYVVDLRMGNIVTSLSGPNHNKNEISGEPSNDFGYQTFVSDNRLYLNDSTHVYCYELKSN